MANRDRRPNAPQRTRTDWGAAKAAYVALDPTERSFARLARELRVSEVTVRKWARRDGWVEAAAAADQRASDKAVQRAVRTREERVRKALGIVDGLLTEFDRELEQRAKEFKPSDLPAIVKLAELLEGEATDRVAVEEVRGVIVAVIRVAGRYVPKDARPAFLAELDEATGGLAQLGDGS